MTTMYNAGLTFEASKLVIEDLSGFHELKEGKVNEDPSAKALERLFLWLTTHKQKSDRLKDEEFTGNGQKDCEFTADEWAQELLFACHEACDEIALIVNEVVAGYSMYCQVNQKIKKGK